MIHAAEVLERLVRDVEIVIKNFSLAPTDILRSIPRSRALSHTTGPGPDSGPPPGVSARRSRGCWMDFGGEESWR